jgi:3-mercaptopyruvate sulfurtransferase SseA
MSANELLTPINQSVQNYDEKSKRLKDSDEIDIVVCFYMTQQKHELTVFPETTIQELVDILDIKKEKRLTFINSRTEKQTNNKNTSMAQLGIQNNDQLLIYDDGDIA